MLGRRPHKRSTLGVAEGNRAADFIQPAISPATANAGSRKKWGPLWRIITSLDELVELRSRIVMVRLANIERMKLMYGPELSRLSEPAREQLLIALAVLISFESWGQMRHWYDLSMEAAQNVWRSAIDRILPSAG